MEMEENSGVLIIMLLFLPCRLLFLQAVITRLKINKKVLIILCVVLQSLIMYNRNCKDVDIWNMWE